MGSISHFDDGNGDGVLVLILTLLSLVFVLFKITAALWFTGAACAATLVYTFISMERDLSSVKREFESELVGTPFRGIAEIAVGSIQYQWGWGVLIAGVVLLFAAAAMKGDGKR